MSLDGSFTCESAFRRLLSRSPALQSNLELLALSNKGEELSAEDVVGVVAELLLHRSHTVAVAGCFRPLIQRIVDKAVDLLRLVPGLGTDINKDEGVEVGEGDVHVVDFYVGRGKGLRLHEAACLAFCRALDLASFLLGSILNYFKFAPPPFHRISTTASGSHLSMEPSIFVGIVRLSFRYIMMNPEVFSELWKWSCVLDLLETSQSTALSKEDMLDITWCCIQILSVVFRMSDRATCRFGLRASEALTCFVRWKEFCLDTAVEKASWYFETPERENQVYSDGQLSLFEKSLDIRSFLIPQQVNEISEQRTWRLKSCGDLSGESMFVLTATLQKSYEMALLAISQKWPVLLHGPAGSGKTALIKALSAADGREVLFIHMDEQMDVKTLVGSYISSEHPGEFRWQPGSLTQAVLKGFWIVFEDIDKAPTEVQSILLPLLEGSNSFPTGRGEAVAVADGFRLFSTISRSKSDLHQGKEVTVSVLWKKVPVHRQNDDDLFDIVNTWYPCLKPYARKLIDTFRRINILACNHIGVFKSGLVQTSDVGMFSSRHLLKWCKRIAGFFSGSCGGSLSMIESKRIYVEAVDIFASYSLSITERLSMRGEIANCWDILIDDAELYPPDKPIIQSFGSYLQVGRITLQPAEKKHAHDNTKPFVNLRSSLHVLEKIACCIKYNEPVLLVGETGTGKTTLVQNLATRLGQPLIVLNLSQQSDVADLLGGFKPADAPSICNPLYHEFLDIFCKTFRRENNADRLFRYEKLVMKKKWERLLNVLKICASEVLMLADKETKSGCGGKRKRSWSKIVELWESLSSRLELALKQISSSAGMSFSFVEGAFVNALRKGHWILLDEINLAPPETLQRIIGVLDGDKGTMCLVERGDITYVERNSYFRLFACMNPATDAGKRDLPLSIRSRFTEHFVDDVLNTEDLTLFVGQYLEDVPGGSKITSEVVSFYKEAKHEAELSLQDGANQKPQFSLRSLARALEFTRKAEKGFGFRRAIYDGFCMFFLTLLDETSRNIMNKLILQHLAEGVMPDEDKDKLFVKYLVGNALSRDTSAESGFVENYIRTESVKENLRNVARALFIKKYPVLLQGPTSSGKTSLVRYLASITGHEFVRINNHEHTDLQEYFGSYITNSYGNLEFQEGILVKAVRMGHWIVLDELNLAPSDVLEALNRLLDDNRELFVPELQETVIPHPDFMLFATQNPPTIYGGRKMLSRAFRNRFLEIHVDDIPDDELSTIIEKRCKIPKSYAGKMVAVMKELQLHRQNSNVFAGKHGFITPRDLFRWANRFNKFGQSYEDLAKDGYLLLAERLREENERNIVQEVLERHLRVKLVISHLYREESISHGDAVDVHRLTTGLPNPEKLMWTSSMWRLYFLVERCYKLREPVLLIGDTGGGKTSVCQLLGHVLGLRLHILNCHQYTETSDFIGGFHPVRDRSRLLNDFKVLIDQLRSTEVYAHYAGNFEISSDIESASSTLDCIDDILNAAKNSSSLHSDVKPQDIDCFMQIKQELILLLQRWRALFIWQDGPLVQAMKDGDLFLIDEISLADDSVLERLNSVLEPERTLSLAEKGGSTLDRLTSHPNFLILATMNPGGDFGKKELSPALRNRFTEIWVPPVSDPDELRSIALKRSAAPELHRLVDPLLSFWEWFNKMETGRMLTIRDLLSWVNFINATESILGGSYAFIHGAFLVLLDGLSLGLGISRDDATKLRTNCFSFLLECLKGAHNSFEESELSVIEKYGWGGHETFVENLCADTSSPLFGINPFYIRKGHLVCKQEGFEFMAPTTRKNALRVLRALQLSKPVLLEGSPGVGKTSLVVALAKYSGHRVVRINLSEQTDMMDLLGSDLPVDNDSQIEFAWSDGILLQAIKDGSWVLLDELNLAPQSVLEGLNAILDHRAEVYIPEINFTFKCPPSFRVFACQNPSYQGGGRKGLPKSFLNRFTKVYVDELGSDDYLRICHSLHPSLSIDFLMKLIAFNRRIHDDTVVLHKYGQDGSPWEFNLRDILRSCQIIEGLSDKTKFESFLSVVYIQRMRTVSDRTEVLKCYEEIFGGNPNINLFPKIIISPDLLSVGDVKIERRHFQPSKVANVQLSMLPQVSCFLEAVLHCIRQQWLCILVGPTSSGKTSILRLLAQMTGNRLEEINLSSGTEVSELLGSFEQYSSSDSLKSIVRRIKHYVYEYCSLRLDSQWEKLMVERADLINRWLAFLDSSSSSAFSLRQGGAYNISLDILLEVIERLILDLEKYHLPLAWSLDDLNKLLKSVLDLQRNAGRIQSGKFQWVSGELINAVEQGNWVVLENANLCNPSVLDRINSLVEPGRSITVNECGLVDGKPLVPSAHPNFRLFLTVDPRYGEVSRAMRNRGVEIFLLETSKLVSGECGYPARENEYDVKLFLFRSGIPSVKLVNAMADAHSHVKESAQKHGSSVTFLHLSCWVQLFQKLLVSGNRLLWSLHVSFEHTYLSSLSEVTGAGIIAQAKCSFLSDPGWITSQGGFFPIFVEWPLSVSLREILWFSHETSIIRNCMYLASLGAQSASSKFYESCQDIPVMDLRKLKSCVIPVHLLEHSFSVAPGKKIQKIDVLPTLDLEIVNSMLYVSANWAIEQASASDFELYIQWFRWYDMQLQPYCKFFESFLSLLERERSHPVWKCIFDFWGTNAPQLSLFSHELVESDNSKRDFGMAKKHFRNAISCVSMLRRSLLQWRTEIECKPQVEVYAQSVLSFLEALRQFEEKVLHKIIEACNFDELINTYSILLDNHIAFWKSVTAKHYGGVFAWDYLMKKIFKLRKDFPEAVDILLVESSNLGNFFGLNLGAPKPLLWLYGGHPLVPSSRELYLKMQKLFAFCYSVWPTHGYRSWGQAYTDNITRLEVSLSSSMDLRQLALQAVCFIPHILLKIGSDTTDNANQIEEIHQRLAQKVEHERNDLQLVILSVREKNSILATSPSTVCCVLPPQVLCERSGIDSWLKTRCLFDIVSIFLDMDLLCELSKCSMMNPDETHKVVSHIYTRLQHALEYSLKHSSRSPLDFSSHQKVLWLIDSWASVSFVQREMANLVHEMWYKWHSSLWTHCFGHLKKFSLSSPDDLCLVLQPVRIATTAQLIQGPCSIREFDAHSLKLRISSRNFYQDASSGGKFFGNLRIAAQSLFEQIIFAHRKSFQEDKFTELMSLLYLLKNTPITDDKLQIIQSILATSGHITLASLVDSIIQPLVNAIYSESLSDLNHTIGYGWLYIGSLRFCLLVSRGGPDPTLKYNFKHAQVLEKISMLVLEKQVRGECESLAGNISLTNNEMQLSNTLQNLNLEQKRLQEKIVFRNDPDDYSRLSSACTDFLDIVFKGIALAENLQRGDDDISVFIDAACNWQVTALCFINQLSQEYPSFIDIIQPLQVAIYEMKLGLSLVSQSALENKFLVKIDEVSEEIILDTTYSLMQFPKVLPSECYFVDDDCNVIEPPSMDPCSISSPQMNLLMKLASLTSKDFPDNMATDVQLHASICGLYLCKLKFNLSSSLVINSVSFQMLGDVFGHLANLWMAMRVKAKSKDVDEHQIFKFKPRAVMIEDLVNDPSILGDTVSDGLQCEEEDTLLEKNFLKMKSVDEEKLLQEEWDMLPEGILNNAILIHSQIFGSSLVGESCVFEATEKDRLQLFVESYSLGIRILKGLPPLLSASLDQNLVPEHLLRVSVEHGHAFKLIQPSHVYNIYKDPNAPELSKMVKPLLVIQERVRSLFDEWPGHPGLQKLLDLTEILLLTPHMTSLSKVLPGLHLLLRRAHTLQEHASRLCVNDVLEPIYSLVLSWQRMELGSWPVMLDELQEQHEKNAAKLWFPLYSMLHRNVVNDADKLLTIQSLDEFIQTASLGEFKMRLQLFVAFHGQFHTTMRLNACTCPYMKDNLDILYNFTGYYIQYLPMILEQIDSGRKLIENEVKELLKLFQWEKQEKNYLSIESFRRTKHKFWKLIKKFNDILQQPVMVILNNELVIKGNKFSIWLEQNASDELSHKMMDFPLDLTQFDEKERLACYADWKYKLGSVSELEHITDEANHIIKHLKSWFTCERFQSGWEEGWISLEIIGRSACEFAKSWKYGGKNLKKRRALTDLLKILEKYGLSRHKSMLCELELKSKEVGVFKEPSYTMEHLLISDASSHCNDVAGPSSNIREESKGYGSSKWHSANQYYFRNLAMIKHVQQICLNFHKDLSLEQVNRAYSFMSHLVLIQQEQRFMLYLFSNQLRKLKRQLSSLEHIGSSNSSFVSNPYALINCMWQQKSIIDRLFSLSKDALLFLHCVEHTHLSSCDTLNFGKDNVTSLLNKFIPKFTQSKNLLDKYLIGSDGIVVTPAECVPIIITRDRENFIWQNFQTIKDFDEGIQNISASGVSCASVIDMLLRRFDNFINQGLLLMNNLRFDELNIRNSSDYTNDTSDRQYAKFYQCFTETSNLITDVLGKVGSHVKSQISSGESDAQNITSWKVVFGTYINDLQLDGVQQAVKRTITSAVNLLCSSAQLESRVISEVLMHMKHLFFLLDLLIILSEGILSELLTMHRTVTEISLMLEHIFASLFSKGFGDAEEQVDDHSCGKSKDATGTGLGDGEGVKDVSDQIEDESQIPGCSEKETEGLDDSHKKQSKGEKGIEMDDDFAAETFSISGESDVSDNDNDEEDLNLDSSMGDAGEGNQVKEELWNKDEDEIPNDGNEKYERGPSVNDIESASKELRAKDDNNTNIDDSDNLDNHQGEVGDKEVNASSSDTEDMDNEGIDKNNAFEEPTGIQVDKKQGNDALEEVNEPQGGTEAEDVDTATDEENENHQSEMDGIGKKEENIDVTDDMDDGPAESEVKIELGESVDNTEKVDKDIPEATKGIPKPETMEEGLETMTDTADYANSMNGHAAENENAMIDANYTSEASVAPYSNLPSEGLSKMEVSLPNTSSTSKLTNGHTRTQSSQNDISLQRHHPSPYRSLGDALEEWKERVKIAQDSQDFGKDTIDNTDEDNADEYQFVPDTEDGNSQALGSAMADQINKNVEYNKLGVDEDRIQPEDVEMPDIVDDDTERQSAKAFESSIVGHEGERLGQDLSKSYEVPREEVVSDILRNHAESVISVQKDFFEKNLYESTLTSNDDSEKRTIDMEQLSKDSKNKAIGDWRRYELVTTKLSQELAEQLRLVLEPTLASKLQGDYKTGKRINMKKVIPYIASNFRRDKIWLRRTRPNKRAYQVVVAVDDSRSMSESQCGNFAMEALVTVCRAMSHLEVGQLAVASFGKKGNITLLHDFDMPFSAEAGAKMISSFSFEQDNTIMDEPMVDLLKYLNSMLDAAVAKSRLPSGTNPLEQLILIIADGHFHEKETVKRYMRNVLSTKRMIAFLLLDNPQDSIVARPEVSFENGKMTIKRYMDTFPFPYYAVLKNIEMLPRTLADLLRQWFELMRNVT